MLRKGSAPKYLESSRGYIKRVAITMGWEKNYTVQKIIIKINKRVKWNLVNK